MLEKYVDRLPIPAILNPAFKKYGITYYKVQMTEFNQKLHRDLPETTVWGYEGTYPGPTFEVKRFEKVRVKWINNLPLKHLLPVDFTIHGAEASNPEVRTVVHLHGGRIEPESDGYPEAWFTNDFKEVGPAFTTKVYEYPNIQQPTTLWYHDHALGITRLNVYSGLAGFYLIRDANESHYNLPRGQYEIPLAIQDRSFNEDGSLFYPNGTETNLCLGASIVPEFFGDNILVNGKVWPYLEVEPRKYRFRLLNGSNSRFYRMELSSGQPFYQIGADQGFFKKPVKVYELILAPGQRADVVLDFSDFKGQNIILTNDAPTPFPDGDPVDPDTTGQIMQFRVILPLSARDTSIIPDEFYQIPGIPESSAVKTRDLTLIETQDSLGRLLLLLDGLKWDDPITEMPVLNTVEIWNLINVTPDTHPIHLHLVRFKILDYQPIDMDYYNTTGRVRPNGSAYLPESNERGWIDTVNANPGIITRIIVPFGPFSGIYPWHCHILEHEDHEMMRPYEVVKRDYDLK